MRPFATPTGQKVTLVGQKMTKGDIAAHNDTTNHDKTGQQVQPVAILLPRTKRLYYHGSTIQDFLFGLVQKIPHFAVYSPPMSNDNAHRIR
jgi:hypothetical protein